MKHFPAPYTRHTKNKCRLYQEKVVKIGDQTKSAEKQSQNIYIYIYFFEICLRFIFTIFYTGSFQVPPEKAPSLKMSIPTQNPNLTFLKVTSTTKLFFAMK